MNIACLIHSLDGGGAERVMAGLASRLADRNHEVTLITLDDGTRDRHEVSENVARMPLDVMSDSRGKISGVWNLIRRVRRVRQTLDSLAPDVLLSFCDRTNVLAGLAVGGHASRRHVPTVLSERSDPAKQTLPPMWQWLRGMAYRNADTIVTQTASAKSFFDSQRLVAPVQVIASAVDTPPVLRDAELASANRRIIAIGRLAYEKGFDRLIDAFAKVAKQHPDWSLRILGEGDQRWALEAQVTAHGIGQHVSMPGWVRPVWGELAEATVFVLPSRYEGFPSALMEAMAVGVPSIAMAEQVGSQAIIREGENGWLAGPSVDDLAVCIESLMRDEATRESVAKQGPAVLDQFGWEAMVDAYEDVLREIA